MAQRIIDLTSLIHNEMWSAPLVNLNEIQSESGVLVMLPLKIQGLASDAVSGDLY